MVRYLSGNFKKTPSSGLTSERYRYLSPGDAEPSLGDPIFPGESPPVGSQYQIVSVEGYPGERYWVPVGGGIIPGSITVYDENNIVGGLNSTTQLNFTGLAITAVGTRTGLSNPGTAVTITIFAPGNNGELLFNSSNDFGTSSKLTFNNTSGLLNAGNSLNVGVGGTVITATGIGSVGIGTTNPTQELHVQGDVRITGTIYDYNNNPGSSTNILGKNIFGGLTWVDPSTVRSGAGGTYQNVQFNNNVGLVDGAPNFIYDEINSRVGIGSTIPTVLLDVLGSSKFNGPTEISQLNVTGVTTTQTLAVSGTSTTRNLQVTGVTTLGFLTGTNAYFTGIVTASKFSGSIELTELNVSGIATVGSLNALGFTSTQSLQVYQASNLNRLKVTGISTFDSQINANSINATGVSTFSNIKIDTNTVSTISGNLILDSNGGTIQVNDPFYITDTTNSTSKDTGSVITEGGVGIEKNLYVGGEARLATSGGITSTGGDLYVYGNLYVGNDTTIDEVNARRGTFTEYLQTKDFNATGLSTINSLIVSGISSFNNNVRFGISSATSVIFNSLVGSGLTPTANNTYDIGSASNRWSTVYANNFSGVFIGNADTATYSINAGIATNIKGGVAYQIPYQSAPNITQFIANGTTGQLLQSNGTTSAPSWVSSVSRASYADTAGIATNIQGGSGGSIPYQSSANVTTFVSVGAAGSVLTSNGTRPIWSSPSSVSVGVASYADNAGISTNIKGGLGGSIPYQTSANVTTFVNVGTAGSILTSDGSKPVWAPPSSIVVTTASYADNAGISTNIKGGSGGSIPYQTSANVTTFVNVGTAGSVLTSDGSKPIWSPPSAVSVGVASYADNAGISTNIKGGSGGSIPYQTSANVTTFVTVGAANSVLTSNGTRPVWAPPSAVSVGVASYADNAGISTNIKGGSGGSIPYQTSANVTTFVNVGVAGSVLTSDGSKPVWSPPSAISVGVASYADNAGISTNIKGGFSGSIPYQTTSNVTTFVTVGAAGSVLTSDGVKPIWSPPSAVTVGVASYADNAGISTNIKGGLGGSIPYQTSANVTTFVNVGAAGSVLTSDGIKPVWVPPSSVVVGNTAYADNAGISTNIKGGSGGSIPYQTSANVTTFVNVGVAGSVLTSDGSKPIWSPPSAVSVGVASYADNAGISTNIKGGLGGSIPYQTSSSVTSFVNVGAAGSVLTSDGSKPVWSPPSAVSVGNAAYADNAGISTNIKGGSGGAIPYQTSANVTTFVNVGAAGSVLTSDGSKPIWSPPSAVSVGVASYADNAGISTNIKGGLGGSIPYQTSANVTTFVNVGAAGSVLTSNGTRPVWSPPSAVSVGNAAYADNAGISTNLKGSTLYSIPYQSATNTTSFLAPGTSGFILQSNGASLAPSWVSPSASSVVRVVNATSTNFVQHFNSGYTSTTLSASIAPSTTTKKILVLVNIPCVIENNGQSGFAACLNLQLRRNTTVIDTAQWNPFSTNSIGIGVYFGDRMTIAYLDSPASTSSITYSVYATGLASSANIFYYTNYASTSSFDVLTYSPSYITLVEVN